MTSTGATAHGEADARAVAALVELVHRWRDEPHAELELRLGSRDREGCFTAGVDGSVFETLLADLQELPGIHGDRQWEEMVDYHYTTPRYERVRTRVRFDSLTMSLNSSHVSKRVEERLTLARDCLGDACRVSLARETPVSDAPATVCPTHVRIQQRRQFRDVRNGRTVWSYDFSKTWSGHSRSAVEHKQHETKPVYEVEIELVDEGGAYRDKRSDATIAASLLLKAKALLGDAPDVELEVHDTGVPAGGRRSKARRVSVERRA